MQLHNLPWWLLMLNEIMYPNKIICLTEEPVEVLFAIGAGEKIIGRSSFVKRPEQALKLPIISKFTSSNIDKIIEMNPDLDLGFSDIQKDIAREVIGHGVNVFISNQRSLSEILQYILSVTALVGKAQEGQTYVSFLQECLKKAADNGKKLKKRPRIYFEEWDEPKITAIKWVSQLIELCGGIDVMGHYSQQSLAKNRMPSDEEVIAADPDIIIACWCGKRVRKEKIKSRKGWQGVAAIKNDLIFEVAPEIFLQPGPAPIVDGTIIFNDIFSDWSEKQ